MNTIQAWHPKRRYRCCDALCCYLREDVRTTAIRVDGQPMSLCAEHWHHYKNAMPEDLRPKEPLPRL